MINVSDWSKRKKRYEDYWNKRNKTPILHVTSPADKIMEFDPGHCKDRWTDAEFHCRQARGFFNNTYYGGDSYPYYLPDHGFDVATSMLGIEVERNNISSWAVHLEKELSEFKDFSFKPDNKDFISMTRALDYYTRDAKGTGAEVDYIVGMVPFNTLYDGVSSLIGPENLCTEMMDNPQEVHRVANAHLELFKKVYSKFEEQTNKYQGGSTNWLGVYSDVPWYYISDDFIVMLSQEFFQEFIMETLVKTTNFHKRSLFHLDGENAVRHLPDILTLDKLTGVQVQATPFKQSAEFWTPYLKDIQKAGKTAWIEARHFDDVKYLVENLEPQGLFIKTWADTKEEVHRMERFVRDYYGTKG